MRKGIACLGLAIVTLGGCRPATDELITTRMFVMATTLDLTLPQDAMRREPELLRSIEAELRQFERDYYAWGDGELAALNLALSQSQAFEASPELAELLARSRSIAALTDGAFDPGVGALVELWGFQRGDRDPSIEPPIDSDIAALLEASGRIGDLAFDAGRVTARPARYTLDLGGIAKGAAVDRVAALLAAAGIEPALINAGGDLAVIGERPDRSWRIGVQAPRGDGILGAIELHRGEAAFTSGDYERFFERDGDRLHHILDPRTGQPADHTQAITVIATDGTLADAAATALFVAGPGRWRAMASALGIEAVLRVDASGQVEMTDAMRDRFNQSAEVESDIIAVAD